MDSFIGISDINIVLHVTNDCQMARINIGKMACDRNIYVCIDCYALHILCFCAP